MKKASPYSEEAFLNVYTIVVLSEMRLHRQIIIAIRIIRKDDVLLTSHNTTNLGHLIRNGKTNL